jgi:PAS domain S-box-containing protein
MSGEKIFLVEDEALVALELQQTLEKYGYEIAGVARNGREAIKMVVETQPDLVLMDIRLEGDMDGVEAARQIKLLTDIPLIYLTAHSDHNSLDRAMPTEPSGYILKPFDDRSLKTTIEITLYKSRKTKQSDSAEKWFSSILNTMGDSIIVYDASFAIMFVNTACERKLRISKDLVMGKKISSIITIVGNKTKQPIVFPTIDEIINRDALTFEDHTLMLDGSKDLTVDVTISPIKIEGENKIGSILVIKDITDRKKIGTTIQLELDASIEMQRRLLPTRDSSIGGVHIDWFLDSCAFGAGDLFDVFKINEKYIGFYIFDVMGHGVAATVTSLMLHRLLSPYPDEGGLVKQFNNEPSPPMKVLTELNKQYYFKRPFQFFTIIYGIIDTDSGQSRLVRAGHEFPLFQSKDGKIEQIKCEGAAIGFLPELSLEEFEFDFHKGDRIFLYSDGLVECVNSENEPFSINGFMNIITAQKDMPLKNIINNVEKNLSEWRGKKQLDDDISLLVLERENS